MKKVNGFVSKAKRAVLAGGAAIFLGHGVGWSAFEENSRGARGIAMGDAYGAVSDSADGFYWNPAALARVPLRQLVGTHADLFTGVKSVDLMADGLVYAHPTLRRGTWAVGWNSLNAKNLYGEDAFTVGYARGTGLKVPFVSGVDVSLGATLKFLRARYTLDSNVNNDPVFSGGKDQRALTGDVGALGRKGPVSVGLAFQNVNEPDFGFREKDRVPLQTRLSGAYEGRLWFMENTTLALELLVERDSTRLHAGWENIFFGDQAAFRLGANADEFTTGLGWRYVAARPELDLAFDYAYVLPLAAAENQSVTHRFTVNLRFGR